MNNINKNVNMFSWSLQAEAALIGIGMEGIRTNLVKVLFLMLIWKQCHLLKVWVTRAGPQSAGRRWGVIAFASLDFVFVGFFFT